TRNVQPAPPLPAPAGRGRGAKQDCGADAAFEQPRVRGLLAFPSSSAEALTSCTPLTNAAGVNRPLAQHSTAHPLTLAEPLSPVLPEDRVALHVADEPTAGAPVVGDDLGSAADDFAPRLLTPLIGEHDRRAASPETPLDEARRTAVTLEEPP